MVSPAPAMDADLRALLESVQLRADTIDFLSSIGCTTIQLYAAWFEQDTLATNVKTVSDRSPGKDEEAQQPKLKAAWKKAVAEATRRLKREAERLSTMEFEEPLAPQIQKRLFENASRYYSWPSFDSETIGSDSMMGRLQKELSNW